MALKIARMVDFCGKSSGLADIKYTVVHESAVIFDADSGLCLSYVRILDLTSALVGMLMSSSKLFLFVKELHLNSCVKLLLELHCVKVIKHVAFSVVDMRSIETTICWGTDYANVSLTQM